LTFIGLHQKDIFTVGEEDESAAPAPKILTDTVTRSVRPAGRDSTGQDLEVDKKHAVADETKPADEGKGRQDASVGREAIRTSEPVLDVYEPPDQRSEFSSEEVGYRAATEIAGKPRRAVEAAAGIDTAARVVDEYSLDARESLTAVARQDDTGFDRRKTDEIDRTERERSLLDTDSIALDSNRMIDLIEVEFLPPPTAPSSQTAVSVPSQQLSENEIDSALADLRSRKDALLSSSPELRLMFTDAGTGKAASREAMADFSPAPPGEDEVQKLLEVCYDIALLTRDEVEYRESMRFIRKLASDEGSPHQEIAEYYLKTLNAAANRGE
jgi:hypothetical protein